MKEYIRYYFKPLIISSMVFLTIFLVFRYAIISDGLYIHNWKVLEDKNGVFGENNNMNIPGTFYRVLKNPSTVVLQAIFQNELAKEENKKARYLYIPQIDASYFVVRVDGRVVGSFGFEDDRTGHIWYQPFIFMLPEDFETIEFELSGVYEIGIDFPMKLVGESQKYKYVLLSFLTSILLPIASGLVITLSIILYLISNTMDRSKRAAYLHLSLASSFGGIWMFDLFPFSTFGTPFIFLIMRKLFTVSGYIGFSALIYGLNREYFESNKFFDKIMIFINLFASVMILMAPSNYLLKVITNNLALILIIDGIYLFWKSLKTFSTVLFGFVFFFILTIVHDGISLFLSTNSKLLSAFGIVSLFAGFSYTLVNEYKEMMVKVTMSHLKSVTDPLTGAYNRGFLSELNYSVEDAFVYIDMDKFKNINDTYGHDVGDEILRMLVITIKKNVRSSDAVIRMGGDEFLVVLRGCPVEKANEIFTHIVEDFESSHELRPVFSYGIVKFNGSLEKTLRAVDDLMYKMKEGKRS